MARVVITWEDIREKIAQMCMEQRIRELDAYDPTHAKYLVPSAIGILLRNVPAGMRLVHADGKELFIFEDDPKAIVGGPKPGIQDDKEWPSREREVLTLLRTIGWNVVNTFAGVTSPQTRSDMIATLRIALGTVDRALGLTSETSMRTGVTESWCERGGPTL